MPVMTIIGCRIFEDEIVHLIEKGTEFEEVIVLESKNIEGLVRKLNELGYSHKVLPLEKIPKTRDRKASSAFTLIVNLLEFTLDGRPKKLKAAVYETI